MLGIGVVVKILEVYLGGFIFAKVVGGIEAEGVSFVGGRVYLGLVVLLVREELSLSSRSQHSLVLIVVLILKLYSLSLIG